MDTDVNHVTLTGTLARGPITRVAGETGSQQVRFTLKVVETGPTGQEFTLFVPIEAYGQAGAVTQALSAGAAVLVAGKVKWQSTTAKDGSKKTSLCVLARLVKRLAPVGLEVSA